MENNNYFVELNTTDVSGYIEKKNGLNYVSWAYAWGTLKNKYPKSFYTIYENKDGWNYFTDGRTCWVKTGVTIVDGDFQLEHIEYLPILDYKNQPINLEKVTSFNVNTSIQRSLTKACARHGVGLFVYAGEDLVPEIDENGNYVSEKEEIKKPISKPTTKQKEEKATITPKGVKDAPTSLESGKSPYNDDNKIIQEINVLLEKYNNDFKVDWFNPAYKDFLKKYGITHDKVCLMETDELNLFLTFLKSKLKSTEKSYNEKVALANENG